MFTRIGTIAEYKQIFIELLLNHTNNVTKVSPMGVLNGISYGVAKLAQRATKDIAIIESHIFPDTAYGIYLDNVADNYGISTRFGASGSSTYIRVVGDPGTTYVAGLHTFTGSSGIVFDIVSNFIISSDGFGYVQVRSQSLGTQTNVDPLTINRVVPIPNGHQYCVNENMPVGGRDQEQDDVFRKRIKEGSDIIARGTLSALNQLFMLINPNVLKIYFRGRDITGKLIIDILAQNGIDFTPVEFDDIGQKASAFLSLSDLNTFNSNNKPNITFRNIVWQPIDVSCRLELIDSVNPDDVRKEIQIRLNKYFDYRYWTLTKIQWIDLIDIVRTTPGVKFVSDNTFTPGSDIVINTEKLPRMRGFLMLNLDGSLILNNSNTLNPVFYPSTPDFSYQRTVYKTLLN